MNLSVDEPPHIKPAKVLRRAANHSTNVHSQCLGAIRTVADSNPETTRILLLVVKDSSHERSIGHSGLKRSDNIVDLRLGCCDRDCEHEIG